jgi:hypothetical protein
MRVKNGKSLLYGNVMLDVLTHSYVKGINKRDAEILRKHILDSNKFFVSDDEMNSGVF